MIPSGARFAVNMFFGAHLIQPCARLRGMQRGLRQALTDGLPAERV